MDGISLSSIFVLIWGWGNHAHRAMLFSLAYGAKAIMHLKIEIPSLHIQLHDLLLYPQAHSDRLD